MNPSAQSNGIGTGVTETSPPRTDATRDNAGIRGPSRSIISGT